MIRFQAMWNKSISADASVSDEWKLSLLDVLCADYYFTMNQLISIQNAFGFPRERVGAVNTALLLSVDYSLSVSS